MSSAVDETELAFFVDGVVMTLMEEHHVPGVTLAVTGKEGPLLLKAYGYANAIERTPATPNDTLFRIASISKTFTAIAIMQLLEQGKLSLDADVRSILPDIAIDDHLGTVTVGGLLSHSAGFEASMLGFFTPSALDDRSAQEQLSSLANDQVNPPGVITAYSNYSFALLGEVIRAASGQDYFSYLEEHVLTPLAMANTSPRLRYGPEPLEDSKLIALRAKEASSHVWQGSYYDVIRFPQVIPSVAPAGAISTTAADMVRYMRMLLNGGSLEGATILQPDTFALMSQPLFQNGPYASANAHGFWTGEMAGHRYLSHSGATNEFIST
ncbi:MAG: serine hydrolase domain-containing protein, partial [Pseudomonadota bacterium]